MTETVSLAELQSALDARGAPLPAAVVHAVAADLLDGAIDASGPPLDPRHVLIDASGRVQGPGGTGCDSVVGLVMEVLGTQLPSRTQLLEQEIAALRDGVPADRERLRRVLRRALCPPAPPREVRAWADATCPVPLGSTEPSDLPTLPPPRLSPEEEAAPTHPEPTRPAEESNLPEVAAPAPAAEASRMDSSLEALQSSFDRADEKLATDLLPAQPDVPSDEPASSRVEARVAEAAGAVLADVAGQGEVRGSSPSGRPVVRHELPRSDPPVSVSSAPAARRSARPAHQGRDSILGPGEDRGWLMWAVVLTALAGAMYLLFFG